MRITKLGGALLGAVFGVLAAATAVSAQDAAANYPNKPIRVIVPFAAGGGNDIFARLVGQKLSEILGQPVINENKPGAGGRIAAEYVMNQPHDGYTLFIGASGVMSIAAAAYPNLSYHPTKTFIPLSMIANFPLILVVPPDHPAKNVKELVEWAKKNPDKSNYAATSPAFITATELLKLKSGMPRPDDPLQEQQRDDPERDAGPDAAGDLRWAAGHSADQGRQGEGARGDRVASAPTSCRTCRAWRRPDFPEVNIKLCSGYFAAVDTPPAIVAKLEAGFRKAINDPDVSSKLKAHGGHAGRQFVGRLPHDDRRGHQELFPT